MTEQLYRKEVHYLDSADSTIDGMPYDVFVPVESPRRWRFLWMEELDTREDLL